ncbi:MAG: polysaccharide pyruvyl transferase CsaB [Clostridiales bacterium]|jgi:polysaccharide pyruvyl transferase CsaB|nr:polysaccharide pyruvyl transferase CsaB [Clostridiales bacterium]
MKPKILMALMSLDIGGAETHVIELCKALNAMGVETLVVSNGGAYVNELEENGITHYKAPLHNKQPLNMIKSLKILAKAIKSNSVTVVHAHARIPAFLCGLLKKKLNFRLVTTAHWVFTTRFPFNWLTNWGDRSIAVSEDIKNYLIERYGIAKERVIITINGIDSDKFVENADSSSIMTEFGFNPSAFRVVSVSRLDKDRSLAARRLIASAEALFEKISGLEIIIVGGGDDFDAIKREADHMNAKLGARVIIMTNARVDVNLFIAACDAFIGVSRAALEAMSSAKPVILAGNEGYIGIFNQNSLEACVKTNFCCRGMEMTDANRLTSDIFTLFTIGEPDRRSLGAYGRETVKTQYSVKRMAADAMKAYKLTARDGVVISGYYGFDNNGDEAVLQSIINGLKTARPNLKITVLSKRPNQTREAYGVDAVNRMNFWLIDQRLKNAALLVSGGGSLLQDVTSTHSLKYYLWIINRALKRKARVALYANGIGPVTRDKNKPLVKSAVERACLITLRDDASLEALKDMGVDRPDAVVTADAAFYDGGLETPETAKNGEKYFCVAVRSWKGLKDGFEREIADFADHMSRNHGLTAVFIAMHPRFDTSISKKIMGMTGEKTSFLSDMSVTGLLGVIKNAEFVVAMRLHTIIYAVKTATPAIAIVYDPKVDAIMEQSGQKTRVAAERANSQVLAAFGDAIMRDKEGVSRSIKEKADGFAIKARENIKLTIALLDWW